MTTRLIVTTLVVALAVPAMAMHFEMNGKMRVRSWALGNWLKVQYAVTGAVENRTLHFGPIPLDGLANCEPPDAPIVHMSSWYDPYPRTATDNYVGLKARKRGPVRLVLGPWTHGDRSLTWAGDVDFGPDATLDGQLATDFWELRIFIRTTDYLFAIESPGS